MARIRLAHVYHWQGRFAEANALFEAVTTPDLRDFVLQHHGKSLCDAGRLAEAEAKLLEALALRRAKDDLELVASTEGALALVRARRARSAPQRTSERQNG